MDITIKQESPKRTLNTEFDANKVIENTENIKLTKLSPIGRYNSSLQNQGKTLKKITSIKFLHSKTIQNKCKSCKTLRHYNKTTIKQIIEKGINFNLKEIISEGEKGTPYENYQKYLVKLNVALAVILSINILISLIENQLYVNETINYISIVGLNSSINNRKLSATENVLLSINLLLSISSAVFIVFIAQARVRILRTDDLYSQLDNTFNSGNLLKSLLKRVIIASIFFPPGVNGIIFYNSPDQISYLYSWNGIICTLSLAKIAIILDCLKCVSHYTSTIACSVCKNYDAIPDLRFALKSIMRQYPFFSLLFLSLYFLLVFSFLIRNFEFATMIKGKYNPIFQKLLNCFWFIFSTMVTVAFGDIRPLTDLGFVVSFLSGIIGYILLTIFLIYISSYSEFTFDEKKSYYKLKTMLSEENNEKKAINVIKTTINLRKTFIRKKRAASQEETNELIIKAFSLVCYLKLYISSFHNEYKISRSWVIPVDDFLINLENNFSKDVLALKKEMTSLNKINEELSIVEKNQKEIEEEMKSITKMQNAIAQYMVQLNNNNILYKFKGQTYITRIYRGYSVDSQDISKNYSCLGNPNHIKEENEEEDNEYTDLAAYNGKHSLFKKI